MRPCGSPKALEERRQRVVTLLDQELSLHEIARRLGCHASSVLRWRNAWQAGGRDALKAKPVPGRPPRLSAKQKASLVDLLRQGAMAHGYRTELWTTQRIAALIARRLGELLHQLGWSPQTPERRAVERGEAAIAAWKQSGWRRVKKTSRGWGPTSSSSTRRSSS
jgi:transposase